MVSDIVQYILKMKNAKGGPLNMWMSFSSVGTSVERLWELSVAIRFVHPSPPESLLLNSYRRRMDHVCQVRLLTQTGTTRRRQKAEVDSVELPAGIADPDDRGAIFQYPFATPSE